MRVAYGRGKRLSKTPAHLAHVAKCRSCDIALRYTLTMSSLLTRPTAERPMVRQIGL